jgi:hypothetical protein
MRFVTKKEARRQATIDYVTDSKEQSVIHHYRRSDRNYTELVTEVQFRRWSKKYCWEDQRTLFWAQTETEILGKLRDRMVQLRVYELERLQELDEALFAWLTPLRNSDGSLRRNSEGLPVFPGTEPRKLRKPNGKVLKDALGRVQYSEAVPMPSLDKLGRFYLLLLEKRMLLRGDTIDRSKAWDEGRKSPTESGGAASAKTEDLAAAAQYLLMQKNPALEEEIALVEAMGEEVVTEPED